MFYKKKLLFRDTLKNVDGVRDNGVKSFLEKTERRDFPKMYRWFFVVFHKRKIGLKVRTAIFK